MLTTNHLVPTVEEDWSYTLIRRPRLNVGCSVMPLPCTWNSFGLISTLYQQFFMKLPGHDANHEPLSGIKTGVIVPEDS
jgi:hypothetical protein